MDYVQVFNDELQSVLRAKPTISKAKMLQITRAAIKGIKFYKHIVQTVEKFIARCRPEYMIPGLYIIDSIARQSRHQFGPERDVYTARFSKNISITFETLYRNCLPDDKPKIIRVLNLWQKNGLFDSKIIQTLLEMANTTTSRMFPKSPDANQDSLGHSSKYPTQVCTNVGLEFSKDLLDFDYGEDDDDDGDETPTEAEPPLSSTLGKIKNKSHHTPSPLNEKSNPNGDRWHRMSSKNPTKGDDSINLSASNVRRSRSRSPPYSFLQKDRSSEVKKTSCKPESNSSELRETLIQDSAARQAERAAERERRCLPKIRDKHLTVCSCTLWLGHLPKSVSEVDISDAFGEYGTISSIDLVPPRGCAYVCMDRRQDAKRALDESNDLRLKNSHIKMAWAPGKGFKEYKKLKDFWEADVGASFIPYSKVDDSIDFDVLEEGGVIDEDSMSMEIRERRELQMKEKKMKKGVLPQTSIGMTMPSMSLVNQPAPVGIGQFPVPPLNLSVPPPVRLSRGLIPFPPPTTSSGNHMALPPPSSFLLGQNMNTPPTNFRTDIEFEKPDGLNSPQSIDQQLSMTERQISMVEQQLNMIQGINRGPPPQPMPPMQRPPQVFQHHNQPNPMMFDMALNQQMLHPSQHMIDPAWNMFATHPSNPLASAEMLVPTSLADGSAMLGVNAGFNDHHSNF
jgi:RNA recognition motif-containing protein